MQMRLSAPASAPRSRTAAAKERSAPLSPEPPLRRKVRATFRPELRGRRSPIGRPRAGVCKEERRLVSASVHGAQQLDRLVRTAGARDPHFARDSETPLDNSPDQLRKLGRVERIERAVDHPVRSFDMTIDG